MPPFPLPHVSEFLAALGHIASYHVCHQQIAYTNQQRKSRDLEYVNKLADSILVNDTTTMKEEPLEEYKLLATVSTAEVQIIDRRTLLLWELY